jgi:PAS domain S-box-containing protein
MCSRHQKDATTDNPAQPEILSEVFAKAFVINPAAIAVARFNNGLIVDVNESWQAMFGYSREEAIGRSALELKLWLTMMDRDLWIKQMQAAASVRSLELTVLRKSGEQFVALCSAEIMKVGDEKFVLSTWLDISERKRMEEELRDARGNLNQIINNIGDPLFVKDSQHRMVLVNAAMCAFAGKRAEELIGKTANDLLPKEAAALLWEQEEKVLTTGRESVAEEGIPDGQGCIHAIMSKKNLLIDKSGNRQVIGVLRDITDQKRLQAQFLQAQKMEAIGVLAGGMAHDFNNLLNVINGYSELLLEPLAQDDPTRRDLEQIREAGQRAAALTTQLLAFSRKQILQPEILDLNTIIDRMSSMLRRLIRENIELVAITQPDLGLINADPGQIQQIIMNLAVNAHDAMLQGGNLTIETANVILGEEYVREHPAVKAGSYVMLAISDSGIGMDSATQARLFEPFFTTKEKGKGTGLGLSTVYGIVKQSNGFIWVYSEPGKGTTFKVYFPRAEGTVPKITEEEKSEQGVKGTETLLISEDEASVRALATRILSEQGYAVIEASNGLEALDIAQAYAGEIHMVITDVVMPAMGGKALVTKLKETRPGIKVLYVSGYTENAIVHHGILDSGIDFLQKPFSVESLLHKVREVLNA